MIKQFIFAVTFFLGTLASAGETNNKLTNSIAVLWAYQDEDEARNPRGKNGLEPGPVDREVVAVWHIPNTAEGRFVLLTGGTHLNNDEARALHVSLIDEKIQFVEQMVKDGLFHRDRAKWQMSIYEKLKRETSLHWYHLEVLEMGNEESLLQVIDQSDLKTFLE